MPNWWQGGKEKKRKNSKKQKRKKINPGSKTDRGWMLRQKCQKKQRKFFKSSTGTNIAEWGRGKKKIKSRMGKKNIVVQKSISVLKYLLKTLSKIEWFTLIRTGSRRKHGKIEGKWLSTFLWSNFCILLCQHHVLVLLLLTENNRVIDVRSKMIRTGTQSSKRCKN